MSTTHSPITDDGSFDMLDQLKGARRFGTRFAVLVTGLVWFLSGAQITLSLFVTQEPPRFPICSTPECNPNKPLLINDCTSPYHYIRPQISIVSTYDLLPSNCETKPWRNVTYIHSCMFAGILVGALCLAPLSDRKGRRPLITFGVLGMFAAAIYSTMAPTIYAYAIARFLVGCSSSACALPSMALLSEITPTHRRQWIVAVQAFAFCVAASYVSILACLVPSWRILTVAVTLPAIFFVFGVPCCGGVYLESPKWLAAKGRMEEAFGTWLRIAKVCNLELDDKLDFDAFVKNELQAAHDRHLKSESDVEEELSLMSVKQMVTPDSVFKAFRTFPSSVWMWVCMWLWIVTAFVYYGVLLDFGDLVSSLRTQGWDDNSILRLFNAPPSNLQVLPHGANKRMLQPVIENPALANLLLSPRLALAVDDTAADPLVHSVDDNNPPAAAHNPMVPSSDLNDRGVRMPADVVKPEEVVSADPVDSGKSEDNPPPADESAPPADDNAAPAAEDNAQPADGPVEVHRRPVEDDAVSADRVVVSPEVEVPSDADSKNPGEPRVKISGPDGELPPTEKKIPGIMKGSGEGPGTKVPVPEVPVLEAKAALAEEASMRGARVVRPEPTTGSEGDAVVAPVTEPAVTEMAKGFGEIGESEDHHGLGKHLNFLDKEKALSYLDNMGDFVRNRSKDIYEQAKQLPSEAGRLYNELEMQQMLNDLYSDMSAQFTPDDPMAPFWANMRLEGLLVLVSFLLEIPAYAIAMCMAAHPLFGRKRTVTSLLFVGGSLIIAAFAAQYLNLPPTVLSVSTLGLTVVGRCCVAAVFMILYLYCAEIFPTSIRGSTLGLLSATARIGCIVAAPVATALDTTLSGLALLVFGALSISAAVASISTLPETYGQPLYDTIDTLEDMYTKNGFVEDFFANWQNRMCGTLGKATCCLGRLGANCLSLPGDRTVSTFEEKGHAWLKKQWRRAGRSSKKHKSTMKHHSRESTAFVPIGDQGNDATNPRLQTRAFDMEDESEFVEPRSGGAV